MHRRPPTGPGPGARTTQPGLARAPSLPLTPPPARAQVGGGGQGFQDGGPGGGGGGAFDDQRGGGGGADGGEDTRARTVTLGPSKQRTKGKKTLKDRMTKCSVL